VRNVVAEMSVDDVDGVVCESPREEERNPQPLSLKAAASCIGEPLLGDGTQSTKRASGVW
jgi:hypothetical protein